MSNRLTISDFLDAGICAPGVGNWFREQGLGVARYRDFKEHGVEIEYAETFLPNAHLEMAIAQARRRAE